MSKKQHHEHRAQPNQEHQLRNVLSLGAAFVVVMLIAIGTREHANRMKARVYEPIPSDQIRIVEQVSGGMHAGACCGEGECLDLTRTECSGEGYVYWPNADLCITACHVLR